jgi:HAD superfamily hydrolase (TIGR01509 family)
MTRSVDLVIFDCDGVLVDSELPANQVFCEALCAEGLDVELADIVRLLKGLSLNSCGDVIRREFALDLTAAFFDRLQKRTFERFRRELQAVPGVAEAMQALSVPYCVASSGSIEKMHFTLGLTDLLHFVDGRLFSASQVPRGKPHPDLFLHAAQSMAVRPSRCVVVEDSRPGVLAAEAAGMRVFGFAGTALADARELADAGAEVFDDMAALPDLVRGLS